MGHVFWYRAATMSEEWRSLLISLKKGKRFDISLFKTSIPSCHSTFHHTQSALVVVTNHYDSNYGEDLVMCRSTDA